MRTPVAQRTVAQIKAMISDGEVGPGQQLPTERDLSVRLGVSRGSVREAIRSLTTLGVLEVRHGAGVYVTALRPADLLEAFSVLAEVSRDETLLEVLQVRRMIEPAATAVAAARATPEDLERIGALLDDMEDGSGPREPAEHGAADLGFHQAIVACAGNATLSAVHAGLSSRTFNERVWAGHGEAGLTETLHEDHRRIHEALLARDPEAARAAAAAHVLRVERWLGARTSPGQEEA
ncbi:FadR/GntR family transcriptional regulator [Nocardiopsis ganjiahuensis]|uniref:FadR/GntR family transcriptional regulator n=1 Tax=Nocardiopsis ganjiahuensis TaxID=239984 RepID=UPI00034D461D|nr:FadR/GntR family transcriptional regulator [Nocardiopsis ganjiahuensis]